MGRHKGAAMITTSVRISPEFYNICLQRGISFSEAMRRGVALMLAELGIGEYDNSLNIVRLLNEYKKKAADWAQKAADLETKYENK